MEIIMRLILPVILFASSALAGPKVTAATVRSDGGNTVVTNVSGTDVIYTVNGNIWTNADGVITTFAKLPLFAPTNVIAAGNSVARSFVVRTPTNYAEAITDQVAFQLINPDSTVDLPFEISVTMYPVPGSSRYNVVYRLGVNVLRRPGEIAAYDVWETAWHTQQRMIEVYKEFVDTNGVLSRQGLGVTFAADNINNSRTDVRDSRVDIAGNNIWFENKSQLNQYAFMGESGEGAGGQAIFWGLIKLRPFQHPTWGSTATRLVFYDESDTKTTMVSQNGNTLWVRADNGGSILFDDTITNFVSQAALADFTGVVRANSISVGGASWTSSTGVPTHNAPVGSIYTRSDGTAGATLYVMEPGGWVAK